MTTRSKNGCITCRIRRVKCDEEKPSCKRCVTSGRTCDGYIAPGEKPLPRRQLAAMVRDLSVIGPISRALAQRPSPSSGSSSMGSTPSPPSEEAIFFDIFRSGTVPSTTQIFPSKVWEGVVLQMAHSEAAVWHAVIAVGSLHQCMQKKGSIPELQRKNLYQKGRWHYNCARHLIGELVGVEKVLTQNLALIAAANMLDRHADAQGFVIESLQIVSADHGRTERLRLLGGNLERMELQAMTFSESSSPYPFPSSATILSVNQWLGRGMGLVPAEFSGPRGDGYDGMASELFGIMRALFLLDDGLITMNPGFGPWQTLVDGFFRRLISWEDRMNAFESQNHQLFTSSSSLSQTTVAATLSVRLYHATLRTLIAAHAFGSEERWDQFLGNFEYIVLLASLLKDELAGAKKGDDRYTVSLEPGFVIPMWMVIHHCRHHVVRHRALKILSEVKRVEGIWRSDATATALAAVVREEEGQHYDKNRHACEAAGEEWLSNRKQGVKNVPWTLWRKDGFVVPGCAQWYEVPAIHVALRVKDILGTTELENGKVYLNLLMSSLADPTAYGESKHITVEVEP